MLKDKFENCSLISFIEYQITEGFMSRTPVHIEPVGYCNLSTNKILEKLFKEYHITCYKGIGFFSSNDYNEANPLKGLNISKFDLPKVYGLDCTGDLETILEFDIIKSVKRTKPLNESEIDRIVNYLEERPYENSHLCYLEDEETEKNKKKIVDILKRFK